MRLKLMFPLSFSMIAITAFAEPDQSNDHRAVIEVAGVVCSFCAHGTQKNLARLDFLDTSEFGSDGVLMEVDRQRITLALDPDRPIDLDAVRGAIVDGGYDPISIEVWRDGQIESRQ